LLLEDSVNPYNDREARVLLYGSINLNARTKKIKINSVYLPEKGDNHG
jgi:hypothetical protein